MIQSVRHDISGVLPFATRPDNLSLHFARLCRGVDEPARHETGCKEDAIDALVQGYSETAMECYKHAFAAWKARCQADIDCLTFAMEARSPLIIGMGDQNVHEFGLSLQSPWGTPFIPGSAIKGVLSSFASEQGGTAWQKTNLLSHVFGGSLALLMFGGVHEQEGPFAGCLDFLDAWWMPSPNRRPFQKDIVNVHYPSYYRGQGGAFPDGTDNPIPVPFAAIRPGERFLFAIRGQESWRLLARDMLRQVAEEHGFGAKTRVGYGRLEYQKSAADYQKEVAGLSDEDLATLFAEKKGDRVFEEIWLAEVGRRACSPALIPLFKKHRPALALLEQLRQAAPKDMREAKRIRDEYKNNLPREKIHPGDPDVQAVFTFCLPLCSGNPASTWLETFAFRAADLLQGKTGEELFDFLENYKEPWPPVTDMIAHIETRTDLDADVKELCLESLRNRLE
ncbi:MAG TPA: type III-B CRISPR module RAMP protein Cmr6 [Desulfobacteraceae bacterium]|nr:type III-B CRISPR module RAMP protein Cmr6 [Desulfobacteraceae bacterium]